MCRECISREGLTVVIGFEDLNKADGIVWDTGVFLGGKEEGI